MNRPVIKYPFLNLRDANADCLDRLKDAAARVIDSGRYIGGEEVERLNASLAELCDAPHAIGVSNGLDALRLIFEGYKTLGRLKAGDEVIVPANTYIASLLAVTQAGLVAVPVDPDVDTMNLSGETVSRSLTERTRAILTVDLYGRMAWDEEMHRVATEHDLLVVEDAAQSIGAQAATDGIGGSRMAGAIGHAGALSFYPTKNIGALGDSGAVITHDADLAAAVRAFANYGSDRRYHNIYCGLNCRMDPIQAAMLSVKLEDIARVCERRRQRAEIYDATIDNPLIIKPQMPDCREESVWHQYVLRIPGGERDRFREYMLRNGVETDIHYPTPPHLQSCYAGLHHGPLPVAEQLAQEVVSIPIGDSTSIERGDPQAIAEIINRFK